MEKKHTINKEMLSLNNNEKVFKKGFDFAKLKKGFLGVVGAAVMGFTALTATGCQHEVPFQPQPPYENPTEPTKPGAKYDSYFKIQTIGGENSNYKVAFPAWYEYLDTVPNEIEPIDMMNSFNGNFKTYINGIKFSDSFKNKYNTDIEIKDFTKFTIDNTISYTNNFDNLIDNLYDVCAPVFADITENIQISDNATLDQKRFYYYYRAINNEAYKSGYSDKFDYSSGSYDQGKTYYTNEKDNIISGWANINNNSTAPIADIETDMANGCPQVIQQMNLMLTGAANKMGVELADLQNIMNLALVRQTLDAVHDYTRITTDHSVHEENNLIDVIKNTAEAQASTQNEISR